MSEPAPPRPYVAGGDLSLTSCGVTLLGGDAPQSVTMGRPGITKLPLEQRMEAVSDLAFSVVLAMQFTERYTPRLVLLEAPDTSRSYGGLVERVALTYEVTRLLGIRGVPVGWVPSPILKGYATGNGGGKDAKLKVRDEAIRLFPELGIEHTKPKKAQTDQADSAFLAAMAADVLGLGRRVPDEQAVAWLWRDSIEYPAGVRL